MKPLTLDEVAAAMGGRLRGRGPASTVSDVRTDSRDLSPGCLFFALAGPNHDGHDFVQDALSGGAAAAVLSDMDRGGGGESGCIIQVSDTRAALGRLAAWYRKQIAAQVVAVVGSCGKTTTKDMIAAVLAGRRRGRAARASYNNEVGVPLTILSADAADEFVIVEIGTNRPGEVAALARIARPNMAVVTNISEEHLEHLGDLHDVAREEFSILTCLRDRSFVVVDHEAMQHSPTDALRGRAVLTYGTSGDADLRAVDLRADQHGYTFRLNGRYQYRVPLLGTHNAINALGAIAIGARFRMTDEEIARGLLTVKPLPMRLEHRCLGSVTLINDAYNANPASMKAAFSVMDGLTDSKRKVLVLGDMAELGDQAERCHREIGREAGRSSAHVIVAAGAYARVVADGATVAAGTTKRIYAYPNLEALGGKIRSLIKPGDAVLLKASRRARFERLIPSIEAVAKTASEP